MEAASAALDAIGLRYENAYAHYLLGVALAGAGRVERAMQALETSLRFRPTVEAHEWLAEIHRKATFSAGKERFHRGRARALRLKS
jgi:hypothetical protein